MVVHILGVAAHLRSVESTEAPHSTSVALLPIVGAAQKNYRVTFLLATQAAMDIHHSRVHSQFTMQAYVWHTASLFHNFTNLAAR